MKQAGVAVRTTRNDSPLIPTHPAPQVGLRALAAGQFQASRPLYHRTPSPPLRPPPSPTPPWPPGWPPCAGCRPVPGQCCAAGGAQQRAGKRVQERAAGGGGARAGAEGGGKGGKKTRCRWETTLRTVDAPDANRVCRSGGRGGGRALGEARCALATLKECQRVQESAVDGGGEREWGEVHDGWGMGFLSCGCDAPQLGGGSGSGVPRLCVECLASGAASGSASRPTAGGRRANLSG